ncbi:hypothetical protein JCM3770_004613 [Rhodotorula araucariae]
MTGELTRHHPDPLTSAEWARLNNFSISSLVISCAASVIHHVQDVPVDAHGYWRALRAVFRPTDAQGSLRFLTRFWGLSLPAASPEAFDAFAKDYRATLAALRVAKSTLPKPDAILDIVRNEVLRTAPAGGSIALAAGAADPPLPSPCPACKANHWLRVCLKRNEYRGAHRGNRKATSAKVATAVALWPAATPAAEPAGALAAQLDDVGVECWLARRPLSSSPAPRSPVLNSGASHSMCGDAALFVHFRRCTPSPVGGIRNRNNGLQVTGVGTLLLRLASGRIVKLNGALLVPGISTTLISSAQHTTLARDNVVLANGSRISRGLYRLHGDLAYPSPSVAGASALLTASSLQAELTTWHQRLAHLAPRSLKSLAKSGDVTVLDIVAGQAVGNEPCNVCHVAHSSRLPIPHSSRSMCAPLEVVPSDVLSVNVPSLSVRR